MVDIVKIGIVGSNRYENNRAIKDMLFKIKNSYSPSEVEIISGGRNNGADPVIKKYALEFGFLYGEYNPAFTTHNLYSKLHAKYYDKPYSPRYIFHRNSIMAKAVDYLIIFTCENEENSELDQLINVATKNNTKLLILS